MPVDKSEPQPEARVVDPAVPFRVQLTHVNGKGLIHGGFMALQLFAEGDQVYVACETCCHAFRGAREPIDCSADELALLEIDLYAASSCELCCVPWSVAELPSIGRDEAQLVSVLSARSRPHGAGVARPIS
jgi:hypothetical protein